MMNKLTIIILIIGITFLIGYLIYNKDIEITSGEINVTWINGTINKLYSESHYDPGILVEIIKGFYQYIGAHIDYKYYIVVNDSIIQVDRDSYIRLNEGRFIHLEYRNGYFYEIWELR